MLEIKKLSKNYTLKKSNQKSITALNNFNLKLMPGIYGILGPNGSGKSTLLNLITGGLKPSSGIILWNNINIKKLNKKYRRILGYMPQQQNLYDSFTGYQFLNYMAVLKEVQPFDLSAKIKLAADKVNLSTELNKKIGTYSGGMKQRLLIAATIISDPKLLIFDEPTAGLDPKERIRFRNLIVDLSKDNIIIIATHIVSDIETISDKIILLKDGELIDIGTPTELISKYAPQQNLEQVYLKIFGAE